EALGDAAGEEDGEGEAELPVGKGNGALSPEARSAALSAGSGRARYTSPPSAASRRSASPASAASGRAHRGPQAAVGLPVSARRAATSTKLRRSRRRELGTGSGSKPPNSSAGRVRRGARP